LPHRSATTKQFEYDREMTVLGSKAEWRVLVRLAISKFRAHGRAIIEKKLYKFKVAIRRGETQRAFSNDIPYVNCRSFGKQ
jgi:hypothetical protein